LLPLGPVRARSGTCQVHGGVAPPRRPGVIPVGLVVTPVPSALSSGGIPNCPVVIQVGRVVIPVLLAPCSVVIPNRPVVIPA